MLNFEELDSKIEGIIENVTVDISHIHHAFSEPFEFRDLTIPELFSVDAMALTLRKQFPAIGGSLAQNIVVMGQSCVKPDLGGAIEFFAKMALSDKVPIKAAFSYLLNAFVQGFPHILDAGKAAEEKKSD